MNQWRFMQPQCQTVESSKIMKKQQKLEEKQWRRRTTHKLATKHKYGPRTLPKPRGWMQQRLGWLQIPIDGRPWWRRGRKSMKNDQEELECSGILRSRCNQLSKMDDLVKMKSRSGVMYAFKLIEVWSDLKQQHLLAIQELPLQQLNSSIYRHMANQMRRKCNKDEMQMQLGGGA